MYSVVTCIYMPFSDFLLHSEWNPEFLPWHKAFAQTVPLLMWPNPPLLTLLQPQWALCSSSNRSCVLLSQAVSFCSSLSPIHSCPRYSFASLTPLSLHVFCLSGTESRVPDLPIKNADFCSLAPFTLLIFFKVFPQSMLYLLFLFSVLILPLEWSSREFLFPGKAPAPTSKIVTDT